MVAVLVQWWRRLLMWAWVQVLFPPGCFLEVVGKPAVLFEGGKPLVSIPLQISSPKLTTIEESRASRKTALEGMARHTLLEVSLSDRERGKQTTCRETDKQKNRGQHDSQQRPEEARKDRWTERQTDPPTERQRDRTRTLQ